MVYLIAEEENEKKHFIAINKFKTYTLIPQDLYVDSRLLYILDLHQGIFIYKILGNG
jgi:hypothetical protein